MRVVLVLDTQQLRVVVAPVRRLMVRLIHISLILHITASVHPSRTTTGHHHQQKSTHEVRPAPRGQIPKLLNMPLERLIPLRALRERIIVVENPPDRQMPDRVAPRGRDRARPARAAARVEQPGRTRDYVGRREGDRRVDERGELRAALGGGEELAWDEARAELVLGADGLCG